VMVDELTHARQQMLMARPWHAAKMDEIWELTGEYREGKGRFTRCLAMVVWTGDDHKTPIFRFLGQLSDGPFSVVGPDQITAARRLLLVLAAEPTTAYYVDEQPDLDAKLAGGAQ
jgi:hypothetical protein